jgi:hypothetical protein
MRLIEHPCDVSLDLIEGDLVQVMSSKERQQVRTSVTATCPGPQVGLCARKR